MEDGKPVQPTRIPVLLVKEITSQLNSLGIDLLNREFVLGTMKYCYDNIALEYEGLVTEISDDAVLQLLADVVFLEIALLGEKGEKLKGKLLEKVLRFRVALVNF